MSENGEIFLADSKGWKKEADAVIQDVKHHVKDIRISEALTKSSDSCVYLNVETLEELKFTVELSSNGFVIVGKYHHDSLNLYPLDQSSTYFETPYSLLESISPAYHQSFGKNLVNRLRKVSEEQLKKDA